MILFIRADSPNVYLGIGNDGQEIAVKTWLAGRELSTQILTEISDICLQSSITQDQINGIVVYEGPGSYTGLRISISVSNTLAYSYQIPIIGSTSDDWIKLGILKLKGINNFTPVSPVYGGEVYTTRPKK